MYEPGTGWAYGAAIDWAGKLVEVLTDSDLETYMRTHIWTPLEISDITFWPYKQAALSARIPGMMARGPDGKLAEFPGLLYNPADFEDAFGGQGAYAVLPEYLKILDSILADDETLLKKETTALMFEPQLTKQSAAAQKFAMQQPSAKMMVGEFVEGVEVNWGLGGILMMDGDEGRRKSRTLIWSGMPNLFWVGLFNTHLVDGFVDVECSSSTAKPDCVASSARRSCRRATARWRKSSRCLRKRCTRRWARYKAELSEQTSGGKEIVEALDQRYQSRVVATRVKLSKQQQSQSLTD